MAFNKSTGLNKKKKPETSQPAIEREMLNVILVYKIWNNTIKERIRVTEIGENGTQPSGNGLDTSPEWKTMDGPLEA